MANLHASSTQNRIADLIDRAETTLDSSGLCVAGGAGAEDVEPDASKYICDSCGKPAVYGVKLSHHGHLTAPNPLTTNAHPRTSAG